LLVLIFVTREYQSSKNVEELRGDRKITTAKRELKKFENTTREQLAYTVQDKATKIQD
jgi:hypothetical protein